MPTHRKMHGRVTGLCGRRQVDLSVGLGAGVRTNPVADLVRYSALRRALGFQLLRQALLHRQPGTWVYAARGDVHTINSGGRARLRPGLFSRSDPQNLRGQRPCGHGARRGWMGSGGGQFGEERWPKYSRSFPAHRRRTSLSRRPQWLFLLRAASRGSSVPWYEGHRACADGYSEVQVARSPTPLDPDPRTFPDRERGLYLKSAETVRYYYGLEGLYRPNAALNPFVKVGLLPRADRALDPQSPSAAHSRISRAMRLPTVRSVSDPSVVFCARGFNFKVF